MKITKNQLRGWIKEVIAEDWWSKLEPDEQSAYIKAHPNSAKAKQAKKEKEGGGDDKKMSDTEKEMDTAAKYANVKMDRGEALDIIKKGELTPDNMQDTFEMIKNYADWMGYTDELEEFEDQLEDIIDDGDVDTFESYAEELLDPDKKEKDMVDAMPREVKESEEEPSKVDSLELEDNPFDTDDTDDVTEGIVKETTKRIYVKEIQQWMKTLEENRYRKLVQADARRVAWFVNNNMSEAYEDMPDSLRKKWSKAAYGREKHLAREFIKHKKNEQKLRESIRSIIRKKIRG